MTGGDPPRAASALEVGNPIVLLERITRGALVLVPVADGACIELVDKGGTLVCVCGVGALAGLVGQHLSRDASLAGATVASGITLRCEDSELDGRVDLGQCRRLGIRSMICMPLRREGAAIGVLNLSSAQVGAFSDDLVAAVSELADFVSAVVVSASQVASVVARMLRRIPGEEAVGAVRSDPPAPPDVGPLPGIAAFVADVLSPGATGRLELRRRIQTVVAGDAIPVVFQPIVDVATGEVAAVEALSRIPGPPDLPPDRWFAEAGALGLGQELELAAVRAACRSAALLPDGVGVAVNIGPDALTADAVLAAIGDLDPARVVVELTEHVAVADYGDLRSHVQELRERGVRLSVDDAGSGYASLCHILRLAPEIIKLDHELSQGIDTDPARQSLASALVTFSRLTGSALVAEGIETAGELEVVQGLGIDFAQGYYLARPAPVAALDLGGCRASSRRKLRLAS